MVIACRNYLANEGATQVAPHVTCPACLTEIKKNPGL
jgi:hypothetical protein